MIYLINTLFNTKLIINYYFLFFIQTPHSELTEQERVGACEMINRRKRRHRARAMAEQEEQFADSEEEAEEEADVDVVNVSSSEEAPAPKKGNFI